MNIPVVTVGEAPEDLVGGLERLHGPVTVVRRCAELPELLAACQSGLARAAVIAEGSEGLTATLVDRLAAVGVAVLVLTDDAGESRRLRGIGASVAGRSTGSAVLADRIAEAVAARSGRRGAGVGGGVTAGRDSGADRDGVGAHFGGDSGRGFAPTEDGPGSGDDSGFGLPEGAGRILAVWGPTGAPGRTMVAVNVAAELAAAGQSVLLIDADSYGASIAASLGLLDESAGLAQACRLADQGLLDAGSLQRVAADVVFRGGQLRVLTGLTRADRWPELRSAALGLLLEVCRDAAQVTVIDCGFCLESDEELSYDTLAPRRNAATLTSLAAADSIIAVGSADAIGLPRLVRGLADMANVVPGSMISNSTPSSAVPGSMIPASAPSRAVPGSTLSSGNSGPTRSTATAALPEGTVVVLNKVRKTAAGRGPENALKLAWERFGPPVEISHFLPWDPEAADKSLLAGALLREAAPDSALRRAVAGIVCAPVQRKRKRPVTTSTEIPLVSR